MLEPVKRLRVSQEVVDQLTRLILSGEITPGRRLPPERELADRLSVTRTSLREGLRQMENMGLVSIRPGDGIYVEDHRDTGTLEFVRFAISKGIMMERDLILSIEEVRRIFAVKMIELAAERIDDTVMENLQAIVDDFPRGASPELLTGEWDFRFFHEIAKATGNRLFVYMLNSIKDVFVQVRWLYSRLDEQSESVATLNARIVDALRAGNKKRAVSLVEKRMKQDSEMLAQLMNQAGFTTGSLDALRDPVLPNRGGEE